MVVCTVIMDNQFDELARHGAEMCKGTSLPTVVLTAKAKEAMLRAQKEGRDPVDALCEFLGIDRSYFENA